VGIGLGIFAGLVVLGVIYLYTQTKDRWNWSRIMKRSLIGIGALITLPVVGILGYLGYDEINDQLNSRPSLVSGIGGVNLGEKVSDVAFKFRLQEITTKQDRDLKQYAIADSNLLIVSYEKSGTVDLIVINCTNFGAKNYTNTYCYESSENILKRYGAKNVDIYCEADSKAIGKQDFSPARLYDVDKYGLSFGLELNLVESVAIQKPNSPVSNHWVLCNSQK
jgi:hypothetical protein